MPISKNDPVKFLFHESKRLAKKKKIFIDAPNSLRYGETWKKVEKLMGLFKQRGLRKGDKILLSIECDKYLVICFLAAFRYGLTVTIFDIKATLRETEGLFRFISFNAVIADQEMIHRWSEALIFDKKKIKLLLPVEHKDQLSMLFGRLFGKKRRGANKCFPQVLKTIEVLPDPPEEPQSQDTALFFFTSGTGLVLTSATMPKPPFSNDSLDAQDNPYFPTEKQSGFYVWLRRIALPP